MFSDFVVIRGLIFKWFVGLFGLYRRGSVLMYDMRTVVAKVPVELDILVKSRQSMTGVPPWPKGSRGVQKQELLSLRGDTKTQKSTRRNIFSVAEA